MDQAELLRWLREDNPERLTGLWRSADRVRRQAVGDEIHLRGLIEVSSHCRRACAYCGLHVGNRDLDRYRMADDEIVACARLATELGYGTVVLQGGEDLALDRERVCRWIHAIDGLGLAVTLSLGERSDEDLSAWRNAGADRYLLRFETSDPALYRRIHPDLPGTVSDRIAQLRSLRRLGYEVGSGFMVGVPGQTWATLANDLLLCHDLDLDMIGIGPYIESPDTAFGRRDPAAWQPAGEEQVPASEILVYTVVALARLLRPDANIPATTAVATVNGEDGRERALLRGANIVMPNLTPVEYRERYAIYPGKACIAETAQQCHGCLSGRIHKIGRRVGSGPGMAPSMSRRAAAPPGGTGVSGLGFSGLGEDTSCCMSPMPTPVPDNPTRPLT